jgi:hypothetical protein
MAIDTYLIGNDGSVTLPTGYAWLHVKTFAATLTRTESDLTGFSDSGKRRRLGVIDLTGSLNGVPAQDSTATASSTTTALAILSTATAALTLNLAGSGTAATKISANCIFNGYSFNSDKNGDATLTVNFSNADGASPAVSWKV